MSRPPFPPGCPVQPLGFKTDRSGVTWCYYRNFQGDKIRLQVGRHGKMSLLTLFGPRAGWLEQHFPQYGPPIREYDKRARCWRSIGKPRVIGFDQPSASDALIAECRRQQGRPLHERILRRFLVLLFLSVVIPPLTAGLAALHTGEVELH